MALNAREKLFVDEYIKLGNAYQAALNAGYKEKTAKYASRWINETPNLNKPNEKGKSHLKPEVKAAIDARMEEKQKELVADQDEVLRYLTDVLRGRTKSSVLARTEMGGEEVIEKPPDEKERLKAAELLGRRYGTFTDKVNVDGAIPIVISGEDALDD
jgi:phage terminase small subunit